MTTEKKYGRMKEGRGTNDDDETIDPDVRIGDRWQSLRYHAIPPSNAVRRTKGVFISIRALPLSLLL